MASISVSARKQREHHFTMYLYTWFCWLAVDWENPCQKFSANSSVKRMVSTDLCCLVEGKLHPPRLGWLPLGWQRDWLLISFWNNLSGVIYNPVEGDIAVWEARNEGSLYTSCKTILVQLLHGCQVASYSCAFHCKVSTYVPMQEMAWSLQSVEMSHLPFLVILSVNCKRFAMIIL